MYKRILSLLVVLLFTASAAYSSLQMIGDQNGDWYRVKKVGKEYVPYGEPVFSTPKEKPFYIGCNKNLNTRWYYPDRGAGTMNIQWFVPPAACSLLAVEFLFYSGGECTAYIWESPFPYLPGMPTSEALDSIMTYFIYDSTGVGASPDGWVAMPETIAGPMPVTSASPGDGDAIITRIDLTLFGGPFDVRDPFFLGYIFTGTDGRPWPLSDDNLGAYVPCMSYQFRTTTASSGTEWYDWRTYGDNVGNWAWRVEVIMFDPRGIEILHDELTDTYSLGPYRVDVTLANAPDDTVTRARLYWSVNDTIFPPAVYDSVDLTGVYPDYSEYITGTFVVGDVIWYWMEADDNQSRTAYWPVAGKYAPKSFTVRGKDPANDMLLVFGNLDLVHEDSYFDVLDSLHTNYDIWYADSSDYGLPDSLVINAGYTMIVWGDYGGRSFAKSTEWVGLYLDGGGNLFLCGQDVLSSTYGYGPAYTSPGEFVYDYLKFTWVWDDAIWDTLPRYIYGAAGDTIAGPFETDMIFYDPMNTWSGQDIWMGTCSLDVADPPVEIFFDESDIPVGWRYIAPAKQGKYRYVFLFYQYGAIADETTPDTAREVNYAQQYTLMENSLNWFATGVQETPPISTPFVFALYQNRPNPVFSNATICYSISNESKVNLKLYNAAGQVVKTLVNSIEKPGMKKVIWDGKDNRGSKVASGVYFYRLETGDKTATRKLILLR